ncbi:MAG: twin-arginine translocation signal domain-containing protein [Balneolaceae bacterium]|nr:MAG: twin-arginine translocation signal domain-containing protein [Balneolaceae bacterium]
MNNRFKRGLTRRDFMKKTTLAAGGGLFFSSLPVGASAFAAGNDTLKVAVVGCGGRGSGAANQALAADPGVKVVALADMFRNRLDSCYNALAQRHLETGRLDVPEEHKFVGLDAYKKAIPLADVVILTAPPGFRPAHFEECVKHGKHMFCEKPVATDAPGIRRFMKAAKEAREKKLNVVLGLQRRYQNNYREGYKRIAGEGMIGDIISAQAYWNEAGVWVRHRESWMSELEYQIHNWFYFTWLAGDQILEQNMHNIDIVNWFTGEYPETAQGMGGREVRTGKEYGQIFDHNFIEYTYPSGIKMHAQCRHQPSAWSRVGETIQGTHGSIVYAGYNNNALITDRKGNVLYDHDGLNDPNPYQQEHDELFAAIRSGKHIDDSDYGAKTTMTAILGRMASYSGQMINWEDAINSDAQLMPYEVTEDTEPPVLPDENGYYPVPIPGVSEPH